MKITLNYNLTLTKNKDKFEKSFFCKMCKNRSFKGVNVVKVVVRGRIELPTRRFSVCCSTD